ncbi:MAG: hypothetical protein LVR00_05350 [Rhabdochlamydiaceae bacterium]|jgi:hypothetical protein
MQNVSEFEKSSIRKLAVEDSQMMQPFDPESLPTKKFFTPWKQAPHSAVRNSESKSYINWISSAAIF